MKRIGLPNYLGMGVSSYVLAVLITYAVGLWTLLLACLVYILSFRALLKLPGGTWLFVWSIIGVLVGIAGGWHYMAVNHLVPLSFFLH